MTPAEAIAMLDAQLAEHGQDVTVLRWTAPGGDPRPKIEVTEVRAFIRPVRPEQLAGDIDETFSNVVVSPTKLAALLPLKKGDIVVTAGGKHRIIEFPGAILLNDVVVRVNLLVGG